MTSLILGRAQKSHSLLNQTPNEQLNETMTFKKPNKKQRQYRKRSEEAEESTPVSVDADSVQESNGTNEEVNNHTSSNDNPQQNEQDLSSSIIADALELRKLRKKFKGIEASELLKSDPDKVKEWAEKDKKKEEDDPWKLKSGGFVDLDKVKGTKWVILFYLFHY